MTGDELKTLARTWWCRGGGAAVIILVAVVSAFRAPHQVMFWASLAFLVAHTAITVHWYVRDRKARITATVLRTHRASRNGVPVRRRPAFVAAPATAKALVAAKNVSE